uniref:Immunity protein 35 domain-containing protein n=1 Tax=Chryseobacterium endophyticum TaxID=1854762 RepID=A0AAU6WPN9_9FLAO
MIDLDYVQQIIEKEISPDFKISRYFDTEDLVIYFWKHKEYDSDDERGRIIGSGPVVYDKKTKEYRVMGSREWFSEEICKLFETEEGKERMNDHDYVMSLFENGEENPDYSHSLIEKSKRIFFAGNM